MPINPINNFLPCNVDMRSLSLRRFIYYYNIIIFGNLRSASLNRWSCLHWVAGLNYLKWLPFFSLSAKK